MLQWEDSVAAKRVATDQNGVIINEDLPQKPALTA